MTATIALPRQPHSDWLNRLRTIMVLRGGQRVVSISGGAVSVSRRAVSGGAVVEALSASGDGQFVASSAGTPPQNQRNYGTSSNMICASSYVSVIRFNLAHIPASASCIGAVLILTKTAVGGGAFVRTLTVHSIAVGNAAWIEGTKDAALAGAGEPCWNALAADGSGGVTTAWSGSAGLSTSGTDYEASAMGSAAYLSNGAVGTTVSVNLNAARVQAWFGAVNTNYGLRLTTSVADNNGSQFASRNHSTAAYRPILQVTYQ